MSDPVPVAGAAPPARPIQPLDLLHLFCVPCTYCMAVAPKLSALVAIVRCGELRVRTRRQGASADADAFSEVALELQHRCPKCGNNGWQLTELGQHLAALFAAFAPHVQPDWKLKTDDVPF